MDKRHALFVLLGLLFVSAHCYKDGDIEDNEFAEFEMDGNAPIDVEESASERLGYSERGRKDMKFNVIFTFFT